MKSVRRSARIACLFMIMAVALSIGAAAVHAQAKPASSNGSESSLESVKPAILARYLDQKVKVEGIIGDYRGDKNRYDLHMDDGSDIDVIGTYPDVAHVHYSVHARVTKDQSGKYVLQELSKERADAGGTARDPLLMAGIALILAAAIMMGIMVSRSRAAQQRSEMDQQIENERRRTDAARAEADRAKQDAARRTKTDGPGNTLVADPGAARLRPDPTIRSIGAVEVTAGPHRGVKYPLQDGENRIGRSVESGCTVVLGDDNEVSSYHGSIIVTVDRRLIYKDESTNGSILNGKTVHHAQAEAASGAVLIIGGYTLRVTLVGGAASHVVVGNQVTEEPAPGVAAIDVAIVSSSPGAPRSTPGLSPRSAPTIGVEPGSATVKRPAAPTALGFGAELATVPGASKRQAFAITRPVTTIGREDRDILLDDDTVSRRHATLTVRDGAFVLTDDGSTHGTRVNGDRVEPGGRTLKNGDRIEFGGGETPLVFHRMDRAEASQA